MHLEVWMFNVNLLNKPGEQTENTEDKSIIYTVDSKKEHPAGGDVQTPDIDSEMNSSKKQNNQKLFIILFLIMTVVVSGSVLIFYYLK